MLHPSVEKAKKEFPIVHTRTENQGEIQPHEKALLNWFHKMNETEKAAFTIGLMFVVWEQQNGFEGESDTDELKGYILDAMQQEDISILEEYMMRRKAEFLKAQEPAKATV